MEKNRTTFKAKYRECFQTLISLFSSVLGISAEVDSANMTFTVSNDEDYVRYSLDKADFKEGEDYEVNVEVVPSITDTYHDLWVNEGVKRQEILARVKSAEILLKSISEIR